MADQLMKKKGVVYGVGVGPGDPELITVKALRRIRESDVIAFPGGNADTSVSFGIARAAYPGITDKQLLAVALPMHRNREKAKAVYRRTAEEMERLLDEGKNIAYLTLGDPTIYCSFSDLAAQLEEDGYETELVNGVPSFCAAAARLHISLAGQEDTLTLVPAASYALTGEEEEGGTQAGRTRVFMKPGKDLKRLRDGIEAEAKAAGGNAGIFAAENVGMEGERLYSGPDEIPDEAGYLTMLIVKEHR